MGICIISDHPTFSPHKSENFNGMPKKTFAVGVSSPAKTSIVNTKEVMKTLVKVHITLALYMNHMLALSFKQTFISPPPIRMVLIGFGKKIYHLL